MRVQNPRCNAQNASRPKTLRFTAQQKQANAINMRLALSFSVSGSTHLRPVTICLKMAVLNNVSAPMCLNLAQCRHHNLQLQQIVQQTFMQAPDLQYSSLDSASRENGMVVRWEASGTM